LELITGIRERRLWPPGTLASDGSVRAAELALQAADLDRGRVGALVHGSVCRDFLEPATACGVHGRLGLPDECLIYDVSNACLGLLNGMLQIAALIELGQIQAGLVVGCENGRPLLETTIAYLNRRHDLNRETIKPAFASLTIGSASAAMLLVRREFSNSHNRLRVAVSRANTQHQELCQSHRDEALASGMQPLMFTESERLMHEGIATGAAAFERFLAVAGWSRSQIASTICHQVGTVHRARMLQTLDLPLDRDYATVETLGNTGSVALPVTLALAAERDFLPAGGRIALLGIGSGINTLMAGVEWNQSYVKGIDDRAAGAFS
jgi:3-oxoacyl-[acyl-carrier-protein] synthase-3